MQAGTAAAVGVAVFVATTPPLGKCLTGEASCAVVEKLNARLAATFGGATIDFFGGFTPELFFLDRIHLNEAGQALRTERALAVLGR